MDRPGQRRLRACIFGAAALILLCFGCGRLGFEAPPVAGEAPDASFDATNESESSTAGNPDGASAGCVADDGPANDTTATGLHITLPATLAGTLCPGDEDYYGVMLQPGEELLASVTYQTEGAYLWLELLDPYVPLSVTGTPSTTGSRAGLMSGKAGLFYVRIRGRVPAMGVTYLLSVRVGEGPRLFISPEGADTNPGTFDAPLRTFDFAVPLLQPGDTLVALDGVYEPATTGSLHVDCAAGAVNGIAGSPVRVVALRERRARIFSDGIDPALRILNCSHWLVEGLHLDGRDVDPNGGTVSALVRVAESSEVILRRLLATHSNRYGEAPIVMLGQNANDVLVEEVEAYDYNAEGFLAWSSERITFRRLYVNSRGYPDLRAGDPLYPSGTAPIDGPSTSPSIGGSNTIRFFGADDSTAENVIGENNEESRSNTNGTLSGSAFLGCVEKSSYRGFFARLSTPGDPHILDLRLENCAAIDSGAVSFYFRGTERTVCDRCTSIASAGSGFSVDFDLDLPTVSPSFTCRSCLAIGSAGLGFVIRDQVEWGVESSNAFGNGGLASPTPESDSRMQVTEIDPALGGCLVYIPEGSPMWMASSNGAHVGANIVHRYEDRVLTDIPLWDPETGAFPCGAVVPGFNDNAPESCIGVHERLHVGTGGCALPYRYP